MISKYTHKISFRLLSKESDSIIPIRASWNCLKNGNHCSAGNGFSWNRFLSLMAAFPIVGARFSAMRLSMFSRSPFVWRSSSLRVGYFGRPIISTILVLRRNVSPVRVTGVFAVLVIQGRRIIWDTQVDIFFIYQTVGFHWSDLLRIRIGPQDVIPWLFIIPLSQYEMVCQKIKYITVYIFYFHKKTIKLIFNISYPA